MPAKTPKEWSRKGESFKKRERKSFKYKLVSLPNLIRIFKKIYCDWLGNVLKLHIFISCHFWQLGKVEKKGSGERGTFDGRKWDGVCTYGWRILLQVWSLLSNGPTAPILIRIRTSLTPFLEANSLLTTLGWKQQQQQRSKQLTREKKNRKN